MESGACVVAPGQTLRPTGPCSKLRPLWPLRGLSNQSEWHGVHRFPSRKMAAIFPIRVRGLDDYYGQPGPQHHGHRKTNANTTPRGFGADALRRSWLPSRPRYQVMDPRTDYGIRLVIRLSSAVEP